MKTHPGLRRSLLRVRDPPPVQDFRHRQAGSDQRSASVGDASVPRQHIHPISPHSPSSPISFPCGLIRCWDSPLRRSFPTSLPPVSPSWTAHLPPPTAPNNRRINKQTSRSQSDASEASTPTWDLDPEFSARWRRENVKPRPAVSPAALGEDAGQGWGSEVKAITSWVAPLSDLRPLVSAHSIRLLWAALPGEAEPLRSAGAAGGS